MARRAERVRLTTDVPRLVAEACRKLGARLDGQHASRKVYCPPLVPQALSYRIDAAGGLTAGYKRLSESTVVSVRSAGAGKPSSRNDHWTFAEGTPKAVIGAYLAPAAGRRITHSRIGGLPVTISLMPEGESLYSGHVVIEWQQRKLAFQVSLHGHENLARAKLMSEALMREVALCSGARPRSHDDGCHLVF